jgi:hypothetical protein
VHSATIKSTSPYSLLKPGVRECYARRVSVLDGPKRCWMLTNANTRTVYKVSRFLGASAHIYLLSKLNSEAELNVDLALFVCHFEIQNNIFCQSKIVLRRFFTEFIMLKMVSHINQTISCLSLLF